MAVTTTYDLGASAITGTILIESALRKIGVLATGRSSTPDEKISALVTLNQVLKIFDSMGFLTSQVQNEESSVTLTAGTSGYALDANAKWVESVVAYDGTIDTPMTMLTSAQYAAIIDKSAVGIPASCYISNDDSTPYMYIHPTPSATQVTANASVTYWYRRKVGILSSVSDSIDLPDEFVRPIIYLLAKDLSLEYNVQGDVKSLIFQESDNSMKLLTMQEIKQVDSATQVI